MRWLPLALAVAALAAPASAQPIGPAPAFCDSSFFVSAGATSITQIVAPVANERIYICGYALNAGAATATFALTAGTGTNCNTGTTALTPVFSLPINGILTNRATTVGERTAPGAALCYTITGTGPMNAVVYYGQY